jgi:hypothetical protein
MGIRGALLLSDYLGKKLRIAGRKGKYAIVGYADYIKLPRAKRNGDWFKVVLLRRDGTPGKTTAVVEAKSITIIS